MALDQATAHDILAYLHAGTAPPAVTTPVRCRLMTANGTSTANGTELATGGGYTSGAGAPATAWAAPATGSQATNAAVSITNMPASTIVGIELWESNATVPRRHEFGSHTSKTLVAGDTLTYASGAITSALA